MLNVQNGPDLAEFFIEEFGKEWNLNSKLREIHMDKNQQFLEKLKNVYN